MNITNSLGFSFRIKMHLNRFQTTKFSEKFSHVFLSNAPIQVINMNFQTGTNSTLFSQSTSGSESSSWNNSFLDSFPGKVPLGSLIIFSDHLFFHWGRISSNSVVSGFVSRFFVGKVISVF